MLNSNPSIGLFDYVENEDRASVFSIAYEYPFPETSGILENTIDFDELYHKNNEQFQKIVLLDSTKFTKICKWEDIQKFINKENGFSEDIINLINECKLPNEYYEHLNIFYINKKRKRNIETINTLLETNLTKGRITNVDKINGKCGKHDKYEPDNIIKKCKRIFISYAIQHINIYINKEKKYEQLLDLEYAYINRLKKDSDIELLKMQLKDIASKDISSKYKSKDKDWNAKIIDEIMKNENGDEKLLNLLNMTFNEWIDIFTYKKENEYNKEINLLQTALFKLNKNNQNNKEYLSKFIFYLYNYKRWFESKKGRSTD